MNAEKEKKKLVMKKSTDPKNRADYCERTKTHITMRPLHIL